MSTFDYSDRKGDYIGTYKGERFYPIDPRPEDIDEEEIAHALSNICRFTGHTRFHYSVAQHCLNCAEYAEASGLGILVQLYVLLHDASEAYIADVARPVKQYFPEYIKMEAGIQAAVWKKFGLPELEHDDNEAKIVKNIDDILLNIEARELLLVADWAKPMDTHGIEIKVMLPGNVEEEWLATLYMLLAQWHMALAAGEE